LQIRIRQASLIDAVLVIQMRQEAFASVRDIYRPRNDRSGIELENHPDRIDAIAAVDDRDAGVLGIYQEGPVLQLTGLAVLSEFRRRGVATQFIRYAEQVARRRGTEALGLFTIAETGNTRVFQRLGFHVVHQRIADWCVSPHFHELYEVEMRRDVQTAP